MRGSFIGFGAAVLMSGLLGSGCAEEADELDRWCCTPGGPPAE